MAPHFKNPRYAIDDRCFLVVLDVSRFVLAAQHDKPKLNGKRKESYSLPIRQMISQWQKPFPGWGDV